MSGFSEPHSKKRMSWLQDILFFSFSLEFRHQVGPDPNDGIEMVACYRSKSIYEPILYP